MIPNYTYFNISIIVTLLLIGLTYYVFTYMGNRSRYYLKSLSFSLVWTTATALIFIVPNEKINLFINNIKFIGIAFSSLYIYFFVNGQLTVDYSIKKRKYLFIIPTLTSIFAILDFKLHFIYKYIYFTKDPTQYMYAYEYGNWFYVHAVFSYIIIFSAFLKLLKAYFLVNERVKKPVLFLLLSIMASLITNMLAVTILSNVEYDISVIAVTISMFLFLSSLKLGPSIDYLMTSKEYILDKLSDLILILDSDQRIISWNKAGKDFVNDLELEPLGLDYNYLYSRWKELKRGKVSKYNENIISYLKEKKEYHFIINKKEIFEGNAIIGYLIEISEITDMFSLYRQLETTAHFDYLTGIYNRNAYMEKINQVVHEVNLPIGIISADVNYLKTINDTNGHIAGDELLKAVTSTIRRNTPQTAFIARIGGDEFTIILINTSDNECSYVINNIVKDASTQRNPIYGSPSIALGYALMTDCSTDIKEVIEKADYAMYKDKGERRRIT